ncbi:FKBP-type peptidyl-prolyl cis-trans isomerase [Motilimonas eburnea]|uniref:FKBP-type peptidyl-prolyl cis-trans isomerase n=1 Tax=Motilimonas eburnea TaxID=1737488 RepID=UPI001E444C5C|nr:FKBP-type peptidyl-prolyl cis-trans isomerase [Motilimonas eburnea]MCE2573382.1 FKBP-type peptidyl-prolyl cis-trans isomerase [Motilimonas eburnea]
MSDNKFASTEAKVSYGVGRQLGEQLAANPFDGLVITAVQEGLADAFGGQPSQVEEAALHEAFQVIAAQIQAKQAEQAKVLAAEGEAFLAENAKRDGVVVTESGLQYEIITQGGGEKPTADSTVRTHYHGELTDGTVFDSSVQRGEPAEFPVGGVIAGWTEALQLMPVGSKYKLYIPHNLAYGERGAGNAIAPYSALVFEVELLEVVA